MFKKGENTIQGEEEGVKRMRNSRGITTIREEERGGATLGVRAEISLHPVEKTTPEQIFMLQPTEHVDIFSSN